MSIKLGSLTFGTDAEFFIRTRAGSPIPVCGLFGGTKDKPKPLDVMGMKGYFVQEDNAAVEFNTPPTNKIYVFCDQISCTLSTIQSLLPQSLILDRDHASVVFSENYLQIPAMGVFGCEPDYNAWTMSANDRPMPPQPGFRSASAHVHIGWEAPTEEDRLELVRLADIFCVLPTIPHETSDDRARRQLYGKAGAFRFKGYGVEHRVLSNSWLKSQESVRQTLLSYLNAVAALNAGVKVDPTDYPRVTAAINKPHEKLSVLLYQKYFRELTNKAEAAGFDFESFYKSFH